MANSLENTGRRQRHSSLCEPEPERLQHAADKFTQQLALEKRRNVSLNDRIAHMTVQVNLKKEGFKQAMADSKQQKRLQTRIEQLENQLLKERQYLNQHLLRNEYLREQVDVLRREKRAFLSTFKDCENEEKQYSRESALAYRSFIGVHNVDSSTAHELIRLKLKGETELNQYESKAFTLQSAIEVERKEEQTKVRKLASAMMDDLSSSKDFVDMRHLLKGLYERWVGLTVQLKQEIEQHTKEIAVLYEAFEQIREATGVADIEEVVTSFIKSEEQNYVLYRQIAAMSTETDSLEEQLSALDSTLSSLNSASEAREREAIESKFTTDQRVVALRSERGKNQRQIASMSEQVSALAGVVGEILSPARELGLVKDREMAEEFNELTAEQVLGTIEDSIAAVMAYMRTKGREQAGFSDIPAKDFAPKTSMVPLEVEQMLEEIADEDDHPLTEREFARKLVLRVKRHEAKAQV